MTGIGFLLLAIFSEVFGSTMLKLSHGFTVWLPSLGVVGGFALAFWFLGKSLKELPLSQAYAIWSGLGTALTATVGWLVFSERLSFINVAGIALIVLGVMVLNLGKRETP